MVGPSLKELKARLDELYESYNEGFLPTDPLHLVHHYGEPRDQEVVGLLSACLAFGRADIISANASALLETMGGSPSSFFREFRPKRDGRLFRRFRHRWLRGEDIACFIHLVKQALEEEGTIEGFFLKGYDEGEESIRPALSSFVERLLTLDPGPFYGGPPLPRGAGVRRLLSSPSNGSPCKRLNLYLRWMVRRGDRIDLGLWPRVSPRKLIIPLDVHVARISWRMAEDITRSLHRLDPDDPVKYDFAICRLGILERCKKVRRNALCRECELRGLCLEEEVRPSP
ncbi:MAG: TIGR02757 family protein [Nitrospinota bacterium]